MPAVEATDGPRSVAVIPPQLGRSARRGTAARYRHGSLLVALIVVGLVAGLGPVTGCPISQLRASCRAAMVEASITLVA